MNEINLNKNKPERKFRASPVTATIWVNEAQTKDGEKAFYRTISLERSFKDKEGAWQNTHSLRASDLPKAILVLNKSYEFIALKEEGESIMED